MPSLPERMIYPRPNRIRRRIPVMPNRRTSMANTITRIMATRTGHADVKKVDTPPTRAFTVVVTPVVTSGAGTIVGAVTVSLCYKQSSISVSLPPGTHLCKPTPNALITTRATIVAQKEST